MSSASGPGCSGGAGGSGGHDKDGDRDKKRRAPRETTAKAREAEIREGKCRKIHQLRQARESEIQTALEQLERQQADIAITHAQLMQQLSEHHRADDEEIEDGSGGEEDIKVGSGSAEGEESNDETDSDCELEHNQAVYIGPAKLSTSSIVMLDVGEFILTERQKNQCFICCNLHILLLNQLSVTLNIILCPLQRLTGSSQLSTGTSLLLLQLQQLFV
ncbi:hypothetical protein C8R44DRAFT_734230 [Mycena epipterygia]|nr:hypothetical protein C8R44DRAFT_734230 [Mycena epipterygia]